MADSGSPRSALTLHLGVIVQNYRNWERPSKGKGKRKPGKVMSTTTGDVAVILEEKYGLFSAFYKAHENDIAGELAKSMQGSLETLLMRGKFDSFDAARKAISSPAAMSAIETMFKTFISSREAERVGLPGTPTKAALMGVNHRLLHPYAKSNRRRPSFRDTGLLQASLKSWLT